MAGRWARLRHLRPVDVQALYEIANDPAIAFRWRYRGHTPSFEEFSQSMKQGVLAHFVVESVDGEFAGYVVAYNADHRHGIVYLAVMMRPDLRGVAWPVEGAILFIDYIFTVWNLRKVYAETLSFNFAQFSSWSGRAFDVQGVLTDHEYYDGSYWDLYVLATTRDQWNTFRNAEQRSLR